ncbi:hypothetical protein [Streptomyces cellostaticus]|uniref:hypothetical protein n=1 Tax=Streptomyces TaxID=1883 RepID=UPI0035A94D78
MTEADATPGTPERLADERMPVWLDDLSRSRVTSGGPAGVVAGGGVVGVTANPSVLQSAMGAGEGHEEQLTELAVRGVTVDGAVRMMTTAHVRAAADHGEITGDAVTGRHERARADLPAVEGARRLPRRGRPAARGRGCRHVRDGPAGTAGRRHRVVEEQGS